MLDNFKPVPHNRLNKLNDNQISNEDVFAAFGASNYDDEPVVEPSIVDEASEHQLKSGKFVIRANKPSNKKRNLIISGVLLFVVAVSASAYLYIHKKPVAASSNQTAAAIVKKTIPVKIYAPLTGVEVASLDIANRPVTGVMIENSPDARPQSGLDQAGVVFEAIAEGGITRFLALFQEAQPDYIGPVRSARPYYVEWAKTFDASYAHVGGSPDALALIKTLSVRDLDQFANGVSYQRISSRDAPHNVYTNFTKMNAINASKGFTSSKFTPWERKDDVKQSPTASIIDLNVSGPTYSPRFTYDVSTNSYLRLQEGVPHYVLARDLTTKKQINPKTVIVLVTTYGLDSDGYHSSYRTTGTGNMYVFQDGIVSNGTWSKTDTNTQYVFTDKNDLPMKLNRGQTWITLVSSDSSVSYKP